MIEYKVLSRKYRPKKLNEVIGQEFTVRTLTNAFTQEKLAHTFLFTGIRGVGKTTIARIIAMGLTVRQKTNQQLTRVAFVQIVKKFLKIDMRMFWK